jgi:protein disulfide-isomerase A1
MVVGMDHERIWKELTRQQGLFACHCDASYIKWTHRISTFSSNYILPIMRVSSFSPVVLALLTSVVRADGDESAAPSDVLSLTASTFESSVNPESLILVEFFAPWCGHCKALAPHYEEAATTLKEKNIKLAKVDCVEEGELCQSHGVQGYPTLKVFKNGSATDYTGPRKADGIVSYMVKQSLPAVSEVTLSNHADFVKSDKVVVVAYLASSTQEPSAEFSAVAEKHRDDYLFGLTTDQDAIAAAAVTPPAIVVYRSFDAPRTEYPYPIADAKSSDVAEWLKDLAIPIIDEVSGENYAVYANSPKPLAYLFVDPTKEDKEDIIAAVKPVAEKFKSKLNFVWIDAIKFGEHAKALNLPEMKWPAFVIQNLESQLKYPLEQSLGTAADVVTDWIEKYIGGKIEPSLKSEPVPETQDESVYTLVGKEFDAVVFDDSKDVFLELYATWCGHCKRLKPIWDQLGDKFAHAKDKITIAKMEATENDLPPSVPFRVSGFPTIKFKPAGSTSFIDYEGDRSFESLVEFVEKNAKNTLPPAPVAQTPVEDAQVPLQAEEPVVESHDEL